MSVKNISGTGFQVRSEPLYLEDISEEENGNFLQKETVYSLSEEINLMVRKIFFSVSYGRGNSFPIEESLDRIAVNKFSSEKEALNDLIILHNFVVTDLFPKDPKSALLIGAGLLSVVQKVFPKAIDAIETLWRVQQTMELKASRLKKRASHPAVTAPKVVSKEGLHRSVTTSKIDSQRCILM